jgi:hypothetical protein
MLADTTHMQYEIRVQGVLDEGWSCLPGGMRVSG